MRPVKTCNCFYTQKGLIHLSRMETSQYVCNFKMTASIMKPGQDGACGLQYSL